MNHLHFKSELKSEFNHPLYWEVTERVKRSASPAVTKYVIKDNVSLCMDGLQYSMVK